MDKVSKISELIKNGRSEEALELLMEATEKEEYLRKKALLLSSRFQRWKYDELHLGGDTKEEIDQIHQAAVDILSDLKKSEEDTAGGFFEKLGIKSLSWVLPLLLILIAGYFFLDQMTEENGEFSFTVYVHGPNGPADLQDYGTVRLRLGSYKVNGKRLDESGDIIFEGIPQSYKKDSVKLEFTEKGFEVMKQDAYTPEQSEKITFIVRPLPMRIHGKVLMEGQAVEGAVVDLGHPQAIDTTDQGGKFEIAIRLTEGSRTSVSISYKGKIRFSSVSESLSSKEQIIWQLDSE